jgi:tripartite-type tricarboxylate transporter receptor subunit TctC
MAVAALPAALPFVQSGEIKALAGTGEHRWPDLPDVPTMIELGYRDFIAETAQFFFAPAKTPPDIVQKLAAKSIEVLKQPAVVAKLRDNGYEVVTHGPDGLRKYIETEVPKWRDVIAKAGIKPV